MCDVRAVFYYIHKSYPERDNLDLERLIKIVFLADWKASISSLGKAITDVKWEIISSEPQMDKDSLKKIIDFVGKKDLKISMGNIEVKLLNAIKPGQKKIIDFVIDSVKDKSDSELTQLVNSTFPALTQDETDDVDLPELAKHYNYELKPKLRPESSISPVYSVDEKASRRAS